MAKYWYQETDTTTGDQSSADVYSCRVIVPFPHKLLSAEVFTHNLVTTGTVTVDLRRTDIGNARGGALVGAQLNNTTLEATTVTASVLTKRSIVLGDTDKAMAPADREYFIIYGSDNSADRFDEAMLKIQVETV